MPDLPLIGHLSCWSVRLPFGRLMITRDRGEGWVSREVFHSRLLVRHERDGEIVAEYDLGSGVVTNAGVNLMAADWSASTPTLKLINYHDTGTGTTAASVSDTALSVPAGIARSVGAQSNLNNVYSSIAVVTYPSTMNIAEWGLFTAPTGGTLWDRRAFTPIAVQLNDQLAWSYSLTLQSGG